MIWNTDKNLETGLTFEVVNHADLSICMVPKPVQHTPDAPTDSTVISLFPWQGKWDRLFLPPSLVCQSLESPSLASGL